MERIFYAENGKSYETTPRLIEWALELMATGMVGEIAMLGNVPPKGFEEVRLGNGGSIMIKDLSVS